MPDARANGAPMDTPCIGVCSIDDLNGRCRGCQRTLAEIASWNRLSPAERIRIMRVLPLRASTESPRR